MFLTKNILVGVCLCISRKIFV